MNKNEERELAILNHICDKGLSSSSDIYYHHVFEKCVKYDLIQKVLVNLRYKRFIRYYDISYLGSLHRKGRKFYILTRDGFEYLKKLEEKDGDKKI